MSERPDDLLEQAKAEISGMARQGLAHPSTKPVLTGAAIGAVAGLVLPLLTIPVGLAAGAGIAFWKRLKR
ncbi:MAG TPA: hypothetical protein VFF89_11250 [Sphingobium sp.]|nr:hypothetical protein [Sphingobium sp.]